MSVATKTSATAPALHHATRFSTFMLLSSSFLWQLHRLVRATRRNRLNFSSSWAAQPPGNRRVVRGGWTGEQPGELSRRRARVRVLLILVSKFSGAAEAESASGPMRARRRETIRGT